MRLLLALAFWQFVFLSLSLSLSVLLSVYSLCLYSPALAQGRISIKFIVFAGKLKSGDNCFKCAARK